jgi:hypothetical protein
MSQDFLNAVAQKKVAEKLKVALNFSLPTQWTPELAHQVALTIVELYPKVHTQSTYLARLRNTLRATGVSQEILEASRLPNITTAHNVLGESARKARAVEGLNPPDVFRSPSLLKARVEGYLKGPRKVTAQMAADFLVAFSARRTEALTLQPGEAEGTVVGVLKKRGEADEAYKLVSCLPQDLLKEFLTFWVSMPLEERRFVIDNDLGKLCDEWGIKRQDLRSIGAWLTSLDASNVTSQLQAIEESTRHAPAKRASANLNYGIVNERPSLKRLVSELREHPDCELDLLYQRLVKQRTGKRSSLML